MASQLPIPSSSSTSPSIPLGPSPTTSTTTPTFDNSDPDPRIHYDTQTQKWVFEDDATGQEFQYDVSRGSWVPVVDEETVRRMISEGYGGGDGAEGEGDANGEGAKGEGGGGNGEGVGEGAGGEEVEWEGELELPQNLPAQNKRQRDNNKKRKRDNNNNNNKNNVDEEGNPINAIDKLRGRGRGGRSKKVKNNANNSTSNEPPPPQRNTAVFVSSLPPEPLTTISRLRRHFSKAGLILEDENGEPKIKMYRTGTGEEGEGEGTFKGEALVVFLREESVGLAETLLDETELGVDDDDDDQKEEDQMVEGRKMLMKVRKAEWDKTKDTKSGAGSGGTATATGDEMKIDENNPTEQQEKKGKKQKGERSDMEKKRQGKRVDRLKAKLADWSSSDEETPTTSNPSNPNSTSTPTINPNSIKPSKVVVLKRMFTLAELEEDPTLLLDLKDDVREECGRLGEVTNVVVYDKEPEGIMTIRFKDEVSAKACILKMNNRYFASRQIIARFHDNKTKYRKSGSRDVEGEEDEEERERLDGFGKWLEGGGE